MNDTYEVRVGKSLQTAWETFLKSPEIFISLTLGMIVLSFIFARLPLVGSLLRWLMFVAFVPAIYLFAEQVRREGKASFSELKKIGNFFPQLVVLFLLKTIFILAGFVLLVLPGFYVVIAYCFAELYVCLEGKTFWEAMESSRRLVNKNFWAILGLCFVAFLLNFVGVMCLAVGMLATLPLSILLLHAAFIDIREQKNIPQIPGPVNLGV